MAIIFLSPNDNNPVGGIKVAYRQSEMLYANNVESYIFHPRKPHFSCTWFSHNVKFFIPRKSPLSYTWFSHKGKFLDPGAFDAKNDFLIILEMWAAQYGRQCINAGLRYGIYVQNGYLIHSGITPLTEGDLRCVYDHADIIMSISEDTSAIISLAFPLISHKKIIRLFPGIGGIFDNGVKKKIISFIPRKLPEHADRVCFYLKQYLTTTGWELLPIINRSENEVASILAESSIFMSFSDLEGFSLPPLEAAFSGNIVVGYTGQGANEYFYKPIFRAVPNGDFKDFVENVRDAICDVEAEIPKSINFLKQIEDMKHTYSTENELFHLLKFASRVNQILAEKMGENHVCPGAIL